MNAKEIYLGLATTFCIFPSLPIPKVTRPNVGVSDCEALSNDWVAIGKDMRVAINKLANVPRK